MRNILYLFTCLTFLCIGTGCNNNECKDVICENGGYCVDGSCHCPDGYDGPGCEIALANRFVGEYVGSMLCDGSRTTETIIITADNNYPTRIHLGGFYATILNGDDFVIPYQEITAGVFIGGSGSIGLSKLSFSYQYNSNGVISNCYFQSN